MPQNFTHAYRHKNKHIFIPNDECLRRGKTIIDYCNSHVQLPNHFYHYRSGGHVAALHHHRLNRFFFKIDLEHFFYSIGRNRVAAALHSFGFRSARTFAKWSCVKSPYGQPRYALPIGFIQSPIISSLVLMKSPLNMAFNDAIQGGCRISVYFDDIVGSSNDQRSADVAFNAILDACREAHFPINHDKIVPVTQNLEAFNCHLSFNASAVLQSRIGEFYEEPRSDDAIRAFENYCTRVTEGAYAGS